jgi:hypothetical protein
VSGFVYFIGPEALLHREWDTALVKIGYTSNHPLDRLRALQTGSPVYLSLWAYTPGSPELERAFHEAFEPLRSHGEWFFAHYKLADFLGYLGQEPNIGNLISAEQMEIALFDNVQSASPPVPVDEAAAWMKSASITPLVRFYPGVLAL